MKTKNEPVANSSDRRGFRLRSTWPFVLTEADMITPQGVSLAVPDQAYSVRDLVERIVPLGLDPSAYRIGSFKIDGSDMEHDEDDYERVGRMSLVDRLAEAGRYRMMAQKAKDDLAVLEAQRSALKGGEGQPRPSGESKDSTTKS